MNRKQYLIKYQTSYDPTTWLEWKTFADSEEYATERFKRHCAKHSIHFTNMIVELN